MDIILLMLETLVLPRVGIRRLAYSSDVYVL